MMGGDFSDEVTGTFKKINGSLTLIAKDDRHAGKRISAAYKIDEIGDEIGEEWEDNESVAIGYYDSSSGKDWVSVSDIDYVHFWLTVPHAKRIVKDKEFANEDKSYEKFYDLVSGIHGMDGDDVVLITLVPDQAGKYPHPTWKDVEEYTDIPKTREQAVWYYQTKDYNHAAELYQKLADLEDPFSEVEYGVMLVDGTGVDQDVEKGLKYIRKASEEDYLYAKTVLGNLYRTGDGVNRNYGEAARLFDIGVRNEYGFAEYELGILYLNGYGVEQNFKEAFHLFEKAEKHGIKQAKKAKDKAETAVDAENGDAENQYYLARSYEFGERPFDKNMDKAMEWMKKSASSGYIDAREDLMHAYFKGHHIEKNYPEALKYADLLADTDDEMLHNEIDDIYSDIGMHYEDGDGVEKDFDYAVKCYQRGVKHNMAQSMWCLADALYDYEDGKYLSKSIDLYKKCAEQKLYYQGSKNAADALASFYLKGKGDVPRNLTEAIHWYQEADALEKDNMQKNPDYYDHSENKNLDTYGTMHPWEMAYCYFHASGDARNYNAGIELCVKLADQYEQRTLNSIFSGYDEEETRKFEESAREGYGSLLFTGLLYKKLGMNEKAEECFNYFRDSGLYKQFPDQPAIKLSYAKAYLTGVVPGHDYQDVIDLCTKGVDEHFEE